MCYLKNMTTLRVALLKVKFKHTVSNNLKLMYLSPNEGFEMCEENYFP